MSVKRDLFWLGWEEWVGLPELGLPAIKAKIDTGAKTSALHAFKIERLGSGRGERVRFGVHPIPGRSDIEVYCEAPVAGVREVTSSNGEKELRPLIRTRIAIGGRAWDIDVTLTNREGMAYRMLVGRQAIRDDMYVDPTSSFRQPRLSHRLYRHLAKVDTPARKLAIALLTNRADDPAVAAVLAAGAARGHIVKVLDPDALEPRLAGTTASLRAGKSELGPFDAAIPRLWPGLGGQGILVLRQLEIMGAAPINAADVIARARKSLAVRQVLARSGIPFSGREDRPAKPLKRARRYLVVGGTVAATYGGGGEPLADLNAGERRAKRAMALAAARTLGLSLAEVTVAGGTSPLVTGLKLNPPLADIEERTGVAAAGLLIDLVERETAIDQRRPLSKAVAPFAATVPPAELAEEK